VAVSSVIGFSSGGCLICSSTFGARGAPTSVRGPHSARKSPDPDRCLFPGHPRSKAAPWLPWIQFASSWPTTIGRARGFACFVGVLGDLRRGLARRRWEAGGPRGGEHSGRRTDGHPDAGDRRWRPLHASGLRIGNRGARADDVRDDDTVFAAMRAGAQGYLLKGANQVEIDRAIRAVVAGEAISPPASHGVC